MNHSILLFVITTILATGNCTICYQCVEGEKTHNLEVYKTCNRFLENHTCNTTWVSSSCVTYVADYLHKRTIVYDCMKEENPIKYGLFEVKLCSSNYCNYGESWGHYNEASRVTLQTSLGFILIASIYFL